MFGSISHGPVGMRGILVNTRILDAPVTGTQRYTRELLACWDQGADTIAPENGARGLSGHAWEQLILPTKTRNRLLFSPSNTGPLWVEDQVVTIHDMAICDCPEGFSPRFVKWYQFLLPRLVRRVKHIIAVSEFTKQRIVTCTGVSGNKVTVIPNGVASRFSSQAVSGLDAARTRLGLPCSRYVLTVGSLEPRKNLKGLLQAWARVQERIPRDVWLVVAGSAGSERVFATTKLETLPHRVFLAGRVEEDVLPPLYAGALAFIYVSLYEGFGLPILEAMASGVPVVAGNRTSIPELVCDAGTLVDPGSDEEIAAGIYAVVSDGVLREELRQRGLSRVKRFSWNETAQKTWQVLQAAAA
ncbi:MAG TPA: glycosyltransferase family 1 protein [Terriglobales bacterium]|nr:glycosyltransferase family 1 protein [Terriglobales bacterium]